MLWLKRLCAEAEIKSFSIHGVRALTARLARTNGACLIGVNEVLIQRATQQVENSKTYTLQSNIIKKALTFSCNCLIYFGAPRGFCPPSPA